MRKDNPPIENPILNLMDKRKKKLHFRYTNTDFINYDSFKMSHFSKDIPPEPNLIIGNFKVGINEKFENFMLERPVEIWKILLKLDFLVQSFR